MVDNSRFFLAAFSRRGSSWRARRLHHAHADEKAEITWV